MSDEASTPNPPPADQGPASPESGGTAPAQPHRGNRCLARAALMLLAPLIFLALLEGLLRLCGVGYSTRFWVDNAGGPKDSLTTNLRFGWRYFPPRVSRWPRPQAVQPRKPANSLRVLVLGESAAFGTPSELYGMPRIMQLQLEALFPDRHVEVINGAMTAINSHTIVDIARDSAAAIKPDWVVIYMGNNEVVGPFGGGSVFGHFTKSRALIRSTLALETTAIAQGFNAVTDPAGTKGGKFETWEGMANFTGQQVAARDPRLPTIYEHYTRNLDEIIAASRRSGAKVLLCTVAVNMRDCPPFASVHRPGFPAEKQAEFDEFMKAGEQALDGGDFYGAEVSFEAALKLDDQYALAWWLRGRTRIDEITAPAEMPPNPPPRQIMEARSFFRRARDYDALRFRCDSLLNRINRSQEAQGQPWLEELLPRGLALTSRSQPDFTLDLEWLANESAGIRAAAGADLFYEHVHPTFYGNFLFGSRISEAIAAREGRDGMADANERPLTEVRAPLEIARCQEALGYTTLEITRVTSSMIEGLLAQPPFTFQWDHARRHGTQLEMWRTHKESQSNGAVVGQSLLAAQAALDARPTDLYVRESVLRQYTLIGDGTAKAIEQARYMLEQIPGDYLMRTQLGDLLQREGKYDEARAEYQKALKANPYYHVARNNLTVLEEHVRQGK